MEKQFKSVRAMIEWLEKEEKLAIYEESPGLVARYREIIIALNDYSTILEGEYLQVLLSDDTESLEHMKMMFNKFYGP